MKGDLHMHSKFSDGSFSPEEVLTMAKASGCEVVALCDHDTVAGVRRMNEAAKNAGIINIPAIEMSSYGICETHILGYNVDISNEKFLTVVRELERVREERALRILDKLKNHNIIIDIEYLRTFADYKISRSHIAYAIAALGYEPSSKFAFEKWLKEGAPAYVGVDKLSPREAIAAINVGGGVAVLAHPVRLKLSDPEKAEFIKQLKTDGLSGIEAKYKRSSQDSVRFFSSIAKNLDLFITPGGDFHNTNNLFLPKVLSVKTIKELKL